MKVSVIIPVYNSSKFITQTLDTLKNQTMSKEDFEIIIVDDVSKDDTFKVIDEYKNKNNLNITLLQLSANSGASMAPRNMALKYAKGEYIQFMDADDHLGLETLQREYDYAVENDSDIVFGRYVGVNGRGVPAGSFKFGNIPHADIVKHHLLYSLTVHKMYRREFMIENNLNFDVSVRHGEEDKLFNVTAYMRAKNISILADYNYYYVIDFIDGTNSHKTTPIGDPEKHFKAVRKSLDEINTNKSFEEQTRIKREYFKRMLYFSIWEKGIVSQKISKDDRRIFFNKLNAIFVKYLKEDDLKYFEHISKQWLLIAVYEGNFSELDNIKKISESNDFRDFSGIGKQALMNKYAGTNHLITISKVPKLENNISMNVNENNLHIDIKWKHKLLFNRIPESINIEFKVSGESIKLLFDAYNIAYNSAEANIDLEQFKNTSISATWYGWINISYGDYTERIKLSIDNGFVPTYRVFRNSNNAMWLKMRMTAKDTLYFETKFTGNSSYKLPKLNSSKRVFLFTIPTHTNLGDQAITFAELKFINEVLPDYQIVPIPRNETTPALNKISKIIKNDDFIILHGGGNMGNLYMWEEFYRRMIIDTFKNTENKIIVFPQTFFVSKGNETYTIESQYYYNNINNLTIVARENMSFDKLKTAYPETKIILTPDIVLSLNERESKNERNGIVFVMRRDKEKILKTSDIDKLKKSLSFDRVINTDTSLMRSDLIINDDREQYLRTLWNQISSGEVMVTDRLHGVIFGFITGTPVVALDNATHKIKSTYETWLYRVPNIKFVKDPSKTEDIVAKVKVVTQVGHSKSKTSQFKKDYKMLKKLLKIK